MKPNLTINTLSNLLTVLIFLLVGVLLFNYFRSVNKISQGDTTSASTEITEEQKSDMSVSEVVKSGFPAEYTVKAGDNLWKISQSAYGSGYNWTAVFEANKSTISDPDILEIGSKITLPKVESESVDYTVVGGDNLWNISKTFCHDGFLWEKIASDNQLPNPRLIEPGLKLTITCR